MNWSLLRSFGKNFRRFAALPAAARARRLRLEPLEGRDLPAAPLQFFFVPLPEQSTLASLEAVGSGSQGTDMTSFLTISATENNTVIYYDQWENGYEAILGTPTQTTGAAATLVWGDNNPANGMPPGYATDVINAGSIIRLRNNVVNATTRNPNAVPQATVYFDGADRIGSDKTISMSRAQFPVANGSVISSGVEVRDTRYYDLNYRAPVGTNTANAGQMFEHVSLHVMASQNNTTVRFDADNNGTFEQTVVLNQGQSAVSTTAVLQGGRVSADKPVQTHLVTGDVGSNFASRSYTLFPDAQATNDYFTPVSPADPVRLFVHNPNGSAITVNYETQTTSGTLGSIAAGSTGSFDVPTFTGTRLFSTGNFLALGTYDTNSTTHDWGFSLQPVSSLSQIAQVGLGVGNSADPPAGQGNTSPIWVTPLSATRVYADWDGNPATGTLTDPLGNRYNQHFDLARLQAQQVRDTTDDDNSGMRLYTLDGTLISSAWGEDIGAPGGSPGFDAGSTVPAVPVPEFFKFSTFAPGGDVNGDGFFNSGDRVRYTLRVRHIGTQPISNALVTDALPGQVTYVANSTFIDSGSGAVAIPDAGTTLFPLDEAGHTISLINPGSTHLVTFDVTINSGLTAGTSSVMNRGLLTFDIFKIPAIDVIDLRGSVGDRVWYDVDGDGAQDAGEPGIPGATVTVTWFGPNGTLGGGDDLVFTTTTGANGIYTIANLPEGAFGVAVTGLPTGLTTPTAGPGTFTLLPGQIRTDVDFGYRGTGTIGNQVFNDLNFNGVQNGGETGVSGATVSLTWFGPDGVLGGTDDYIFPAVTTAVAGTYSFTNLPAGNFRAQFATPTGFVFAPQDQGGNDALDSDANTTTGFTATIALAAGGTNNDTDAGMYRQADLQVTKTDGSPTYTPGAAITYTIVVTNAGPSFVTGASVADTIPANISGATWTVAYAGVGSTGPASGSGNISATVDLAVGGTATFTLTGTVLSSATGNLVNTASVTAPTGTNDPTPGNNSATDTDTPDPRADLQITKTDGTATYTPGVGTTYTIVVTNAGPSNVTGASVVDNLPAQIGSATWTVAYSAGASGPASGSGNINTTVNLAAGATATFTVVASTLSSATGNLVNTATVSTPPGTTDPTPGNNSATDTDTPDPRADLSITKTDGVATYTPGVGTTYTIVVTNSGPSSVTGATVVDNLPAQIGSATWTVAYSAGASGPASGSGNINASVNLASGATATFTVVASTLSSATGNLVNTATVSTPPGTTDPTPGNNTATDTDTPDPRADLQITKTDGTATYTPGVGTTYTIVVTNAGPSNVTGASVVDNLPAQIGSATWTVAYSAGASGPASGSGNISASVNLAPGATATFTVVAAINASATGSLVNTATVSTPPGTTDPTPGNNSATDTDTPDPRADLRVTKTDGTATYTPGLGTTYTIVVTNAGPSNVTGASVVDNLPAQIGSATWTVAYSAGASGPASGSGNINASVNLASGATATFTVVASILSSATGNLVNTATVATPPGTTDPTPGNNSATDTDTPDPRADLQVTKTDGTPTYTAGGSTTYTIVVTNAGPSNVTGATVVDNLPTQITSATWTVAYSAGASGPASGSGNINTAVNLASGATATFTVVAAINPTATGNLVNTVTVATPPGTTDPTPGNNSATDTDTQGGAPNLFVTKTDGVIVTTPGSTLVYTITYGNAGNRPSTDVTLFETLPAGTTFNAAASTAGWVDFGGGDYRLDVADLAVGAGGTVTFAVTVNSTVPAGQTVIDNFVEIADDESNGPDADPTDNFDTDTDGLTAAPDLVVTKDDGVASTTPGSTLTYTITVQNVGTQGATGVTVTDPLPANTAFVSATGGGTFSAGVVTWNVGGLAAGATLSFTVTVQVAAAVPAGTTSLVNSASAADDGTNGPDPTPGDNTDSDTDTLVAAPDLVVTKDDGVTTARPGDVLTYTVTVTNAGNQGATGVVVVDTLPANTAFVSATGGGTFAAGAVTWSVGGLAAGASATFTVTVRVSAMVPAGATALVNTATATDDGTNGPDPTPGDNTDTDTDTLVAAPDLVVTKDDGLVTTTPGSTLTYTIRYANAGNQDATGVVITEALPAGTSFSAVANPGWVDQLNGTFTLAVGNLVAGANGTATFVVTVNGPAAAGQTQVVNSVAVADDGTNGPDPTPGNNTATDTDTLDATPDLVVTKDDGVALANPGDTLTYTVTVRNVGNQDATGVALTDTIPDLTSFVGATGGGTFNRGVVTWNLGDLAGGASITVTVTVQVDATVPAGATTLVNSATANDDGTNGPDPTPPDNTGTDADALGGSIDLTLTNSDGILVTTPGNSQVYSLGYANVGPRGATGVVITETLPAGTTFDPVASDPNWVDQGNGTYTLVIGSVPAGGTGIVFFAVRVNDPAAAGQDQVVNPAVIGDDGVNGPDPTPANNAATDIDTLSATPDLVVTKDDGVTTARPGDVLTYTVTVTNAGNQGATGVVVVDTLPANTAFTSATGGGTFAAGTVTWNIGNLAAGATVSFTVTVQVAATVPAGATALTNTASANDDGTNGPDPTPGDNTDTDTDTLDATPDLVVTKTDGVTNTTPGSTLTYTITVTNAGNQDATGVTLSDVLPPNTTFVAASGGGTAGPGGVTWAIGNLAAGATVTRTVTLAVNAAVPAGATSLVNTATATDDGTNGPDPTPPNNTGTDTDTLDAAPDLVVTKDDGVLTARPGDTLTYTITVRNAGNQGATGVVLADTLPGLTTFVSATGGGTHAAGIVTWNLGSLAAGASATFTVTVRVAASVPAGATSLVNTASATDDGTNGPDPTPPNNTGSDTDTLDAAPDLSVTKTDGRTVVIPGSSVVYTLSYRNAGNQDATGVVITEALPAGTSFDAAASSPGWALQRNGTFTLVVGNLAAGASGTVTFVVTVNNPVPAGQTRIINTATITDDGTNGPDPTPPDNTGTDTTDINRLPLAVDDVATADEDNPVTIPNADLLVNDDQGDAPAVVIAVSPTSVQGGTVVLGPNGAVYTPPANFTGNDSFTYTIRDTNGDTSTATVRLSVVPADRTASVGDRVWVDFDGDGVQDADEPGLPGVTLTLTRAGRDGDFATAADNTTFTTVTGPNGEYRFDTLPAGLYRVAATGGLPAGVAATFDPDGGNDGQAVFTLTSGQVRTDLDLGYCGTSRLTGIVYRDYHVNGQFEPTAPTPETGIGGITVTLTGTDVAGNAITRTTVTAADGTYSFIGLLGGTYTLTEGAVPAVTEPGGFYDGLDAAGAAGGTAGNDVISSIVLGTGVNGDGYSFGENPPADPFGFVFDDRNHNGVRDAGESGIPGVVVTVSGVAFAGTPLARTLTAAEVAGGLTAITDATGRWEFRIIPPGVYTITEAQPAGYADGAEQNADPNGPFTVVVGQDAFSNVELTPSPIRGPFNFAELLLPGPGGMIPTMNFFPEQPGEMSKRMFLGSTAEERAIDTGTPTDPNFAAFNPGVRATAFLVTAQDAGGGWVRVFDFAAGVERFRFQPYGDYAGGVRVTTADVTGDGIPDVITAPGAGGGPVVKVFDGDTGAEVSSAMAFEAGFRGGLQVAAGDFNGDGIADVVVTPDEGGGPIVRVLDGRTLAPLANFFALDEAFRGGLRIAAGDINRDGVADLVVTAGLGGGPRVAVYDGRTVTTTPGRLMNDFFGFAPELRNGFWVSAADVDGDSFADVVLGAGTGGSPRVATYSGRLIGSAGGPVMISSILAGDEASRDGARVAAVDLDGDGRAELAAAGADGESIVNLYDPITGRRRDAFRAFPADFLGGVFVG